MIGFWLKLLFLLAAGISVLHAAPTAVPRDFVVDIQATVSDSSPHIVLSWTQRLQANIASQSIYRRVKQTGAVPNSWSLLQTLANTDTGYTDATAQVGVEYEYWMNRTFTGLSGGQPFNASGYISAGVKVPQVDSRGILLLVVDDTMVAPLAPEIAQLKADLAGDGWTVQQITAPRTGTAASTKVLIKAAYDADPANVKNIYLLGHVPVPYSGRLYPPDAHTDQAGAWPTDGYYGEMTSDWTDTTVNISIFATSKNIPGDGRFDQSYYPSTVEVPTGRVDLYSMSRAPTSAVTETELLRRYLRKAHDFRHKQGAYANIARSTLVRDGGNLLANQEPLGMSILAAGFNSVAEPPAAPVIDEDSAIMADNSWLPYTAGTHLMGFLGGGGHTQRSGNMTPDDVGRKPNLTVFNGMMGSGFGNWDTVDNMMRSTLAGNADGTSLGLTCFWIARPHYFLHQLGMGETIGFATRTSQNGSLTGYSPLGYFGGYIHVGLVGDPALRLHMVAPVAGLGATTANGQVDLAWSASAETRLQGYHVYRAASADGPFTRLTANPRAATNYTDTTVTSGQSYTYMVRVLKLELTPGGSYYNQSIGVPVTLTVNAGATAAPSNPANLAATLVNSTRADLAWTDTSASETGFRIERKTNAGGAYATLATLPADTAAYTDPGPFASGNTYYYRVFALGSAADSVASNETSFRALAGFVDCPQTKIKFNKDVGTAQIPVERFGGAVGAITLNYTATAGSAVAGTHFTAPSGTLTWNDGEKGVKYVPVAITNTPAAQAARQFRLTLGSATNGAGIGRFSSCAVLIEDPTATLPAPWLQGGSATLNDSSPAVMAEGGIASTTMGNSGLSSGATVDDGQFVYQTRTGDGILTAYVPAVTPVQTGARFAVLVRDNPTGGGAAMAGTVASQDGVNFGTKLLYRTSTYAATIAVGADSTQTLPRWMRIARSGNVFVSQSSVDGANWTTVGAVSVTLPATAYWGVMHLSTGQSVDGTHYADFQLGQFQNTAFADLPALPEAPAAPTATAGGSANVNLAWGATIAAAGYRVERRTDDGRVEQIAIITSGTTTTYADTNVPPDTACQYRVIATNANGESSWSPATTVTTPPDAVSTAPLRPSFLTVAPGGSGIVLQWTDGSSNETGFTVQRRVLNGDWAPLQTLPANTTACTDDTPLPGVIYEYRVSAYNAAGSSSWTVAVATLRHTGAAAINRGVWSADGLIYHLAPDSPGSAYVPTSFTYDSPAITHTTSQTLGSIQAASNGWYGFKMTVGNTPLVIRELGRWVVSGNTAAHTVKLVDAATGVDVPNGSASVTTAGAPVGYAYAALATPATLAANTAYYVVSQEFETESFYDGANSLVTTSDATVNNSVFNNNGVNTSIDFESPNYAVGNTYVANGTSNTLPVAGPALHRFTGGAAAASDNWTATVETAGPTGNRLLISTPSSSALSNGSGFSVRTTVPGANTGTWFAQMDYTRLTSSGGPLVSMRLLNSSGSLILGHPNNALLYADRWNGVTLAVGSTHVIRVEIDVATGIWRQYLDGTLVNTVAATSTNITFGGLQLAFWGSTYNGPVCALDNIVVGKVATTPNDLYAASTTGAKSYGPVAFRYTLPSQPFVNGHNLTALRNDYTGWLGMELTVGSSPLPIERLGRWVAPGNTGVHALRLVDAATGNTLATATVDTLDAPSAGQFQYADLSAPVTLAAGSTYYVLSQETAGGDQWYDFSTPAPGAATGYQTWLAANGLPMDASGAGAATSTPSSDGVTNLMKYALGLAPGTTGTGGRLGYGTTTDSGDNYLTFSYTRPEPAPTGITYTVECSPDLTSGSWSSVGLVEIGNVPNANLRTITMRDTSPLSAATPKRFMRLKVSQP